LYEDVINGTKKFIESGCDTILAIGGGSAIDIAKAIKYFSKSSSDIIAIPTTAGTGSESTHFAVIYKDGVKQSLADNSLLPSYVILEPSAISSVPEYIRKATMMDALCHAIESYWAKKATDESRDVSRRAIHEILINKESYLLNEYNGNQGMLRAANLAGQAINITTTTAAHAMSYKITSLYGFAHGHAVAICMPEVWRINAMEIPEITLNEYEEILASLKLEYPVSNNWKADIDILSSSVNLDRLKNNPVDLNKYEIIKIYERIIHESR
jgi:alcohol dehydrogenase class IV